MKRVLILAALVAAGSLPAGAQTVADTLKEVTTKGVVMTAAVQGQQVPINYTFKSDGTYASTFMGQSGAGTWKIDGDKLCTRSQLGENCAVYPAGKKSGDQFKVQGSSLGEATVKIK